MLVEGFDADQIGLARNLARHPAPAATAGSGTECARVRLAGPGPAPAEALALAASHGVSVEPHTDLDTDPGPADTAYLDVWTPEVAPRVRKLRERGALVTSIGDLLLERAEGLTIGITGTAGKTTAATITRQLLLAAGVNVDASSTGRLGNVWPTAELLDREEDDRPLLLELTSSHLAFMRESPRIAAITCFWPDHLELHGSLDAYRAAKETIVRGQRPGDTVVVNADDPGGRRVRGAHPRAARRGVARAARRARSLRAARQGADPLGRRRDGRRHARSSPIRRAAACRRARGPGSGCRRRRPARRACTRARPGCRAAGPPRPSASEPWPAYR